MKIELKFDGSTTIIHRRDGIPVLPMGCTVSLVGKFTNQSPTAVSIESPKTSQEVLLWLITKDTYSPHMYMVNPSSIDAMGEVTAPLPVKVNLAPSESTGILVKLNDYNKDLWFEPGVYEVSLEYLGVKSSPVKFATEFVLESVPRLVDLALNDPNTWIREQSIEWLNKLPKGPNLAIPKAGADKAEIESIQAGNMLRAEEFLGHWPTTSQSVEVMRFFQSHSTQ